MKPIQTYSTFSGEMVEVKDLKKRIEWLKDQIIIRADPNYKGKKGIYDIIEEAFEGVE